jgi:hypothetical protein
MPSKFAHMAEQRERVAGGGARYRRDGERRRATDERGVLTGLRRMPRCHCRSSLAAGVLVRRMDNLRVVDHSR